MSDIDSNVSTEQTDSTPATEETPKQPYKNPRIACLEEVEAMVGTLLTSWEAEQDGQDKDSALSVLGVVAQNIADMKQPRRVGRKPSDTPKAEHPHFVLVAPDGTRVYLKSERTPSKATHGAFAAACYGPFRRAAGADYCVRNGLTESHPRVF